MLMLFTGKILLQGCFMECEILRSTMTSYQSLLNSTTVLFDKLHALYNTVECWTDCDSATIISLQKEVAT